MTRTAGGWRGLSWYGVEQSVMERLTGQQFIESDFQPHSIFRGRAEQQPAAERFPASWGVMF